MPASNAPVKTLVFVYGTLKKGYSNHHYLHGQTFIQEAETLPNYRLWDCGRYPCMVEDKKGNSIQGEVWEVDEHCLRAMDRLEGVPFLYRRDVIKLENFHKPVIGYLFQRDTDDYIDCGRSWPRE